MTVQDACRPSMMQLRSYFEQALSSAEAYRGSTAPNPPVGAIAWDREGQVLGLAAHVRAGEEHAEAALIRRVQELGALDRVHGVLVTLEPCNHHGKTPPCSEALLRNLPQLQWLFYGATDLNPRVAGGGAERLRAAGISVLSLQDELGHSDSLCLRGQRLLAAFFKKMNQGRPWVTLKTAHLFPPLNDCEFQSLDYLRSSMVPPEGQKTFTSEEALVLAHSLRKRADSIITGAGTAVIDRPLFTVRRVTDFEGKLRRVYVVGREDDRLADWMASLDRRFFDGVPQVFPTVAELFAGLRDSIELEVLVEAGPKLTKVILDFELWDEHHVFVNASTGEGTEHRIRFREPQS